MEHRSRRNGIDRKRLVDRLDRATRDVNAFLLVVAIGLATLDFTCYCAFKITEAMPPDALATASAVAPIAATPVSVPASNPGPASQAATSPDGTTTPEAAAPTAAPQDVRAVPERRSRAAARLKAVVAHLHRAPGD